MRTQNEDHRVYGLRERPFITVTAKSFFKKPEAAKKNAAVPNHMDGRQCATCIAESDG